MSWYISNDRRIQALNGSPSLPWWIHPPERPEPVSDEQRQNEVPDADPEPRQ